jgi:hypothetical protein
MISYGKTLVPRAPIIMVMPVPLCAMSLIRERSTPFGEASGDMVCS